MAADFWSSTQHKSWQFTKADFLRNEDARAVEDRTFARQWPLPDGRLVNIYLQQQIVKLAKRLSIQQPVIATAITFVRRFYLKVQIRRTNPYLLLATAFYLACKVEESPQHIKMVLTEARNMWPDFISPLPGTLGECEFLLISEIGGHLIVHHPYRALKQLQETLALTQEEFSTAWSFINDHYNTCLPFVHAPHVIAAAAASFVLTVKPSQASSSTAVSGMKAGPTLPSTPAVATQTQTKLQRLRDWLVSSDIDIAGMVDCTQEMISLYTIWEQYSDRETREQINRFVRDRKLER